jgi:hypothetical protein
MPILVAGHVPPGATFLKFERFVKCCPVQCTATQSASLLAKPLMWISQSRLPRSRARKCASRVPRHGPGTDKQALRVSNERHKSSARYLALRPSDHGIQLRCEPFTPPPLHQSHSSHRRWPIVAPCGQHPRFDVAYFALLPNGGAPIARQYR